MHKFDILDPQLNIFQSRFLEASAGTGKTFAIEHLAVRLLLESEEPITLGEILAVTFTREAAHEMKTRIREKLESLLPEGNPRVSRALASFDEIQVFTIHGFCHRMLTEYAFEASAPLQLSSPDKPDHLTEMRKTVEDFLQTGDSRFASDVTALLKKHRYDIGKLIAQVTDKMQKEDQPLDFEIPKLPTISMEELKEDIYALAPRYKRLKIEEYETQIESFASYLKKQDSSSLLEEKEWFFEKMHEENTKVRAAPLATISLKAPKLFESLQNKLLPQLQIARDSEERLKRIASECRNRWLVKAKRHDYFTFDDLLHKMAYAIKQENFKDKVKGKYKAVIVDEFQDTDPIQWKIFKDLFLESHLIYLVGDPKQSIYGFRSADIYTYMEAADALGKEAKAHLDTNFRSSPELIDALNHLFTQRSDWLDLPHLPGTLTYHRVKAGRTDSKLDEEPITFFGAYDDPGRGRSFPTKKIEEEKLFPYIASEILRLLPKVPFSEMAILVKDRYQGQRLQLHLNRWKIPSIIKRTFNLAHSRGFLCMELLLKAVSRPDHENSVRAALYSPLMEGDLNPFFALKKLYDEHGFSTFFSHFISEHFCSHCDTDLYLEIRQTAEILMEYSHASPIDLLHEMAQLKLMTPELDPRLKLRGEEGDAKVPIMTTFASKGLEFEVVFALSVASRHFEKEQDPEKQAEKMRQLYVALTRPKEKLYIPYLVDSSKKQTRSGLSAIELFFGSSPPSMHLIGDVVFNPYVSQKEEPILHPPPEVNLNFEAEYLTSFSSMAKPHATSLIGERFRMQDLKKKTLHTLPLGAETGTLIHAIFEAHFQDRSISIEQVALETLSGTHLEGWEEVIVDMAYKIINMPLDGEFCLADLKEGDYLQEMEFLFPKDKQLIKGFADLVFKRGDTFYVLDWKTNWVGPSDDDYSEENLHKVMRDHDYYLQANLYSEAIMRYVKPLYKNPKLGGAYYIFVRGKKGVHFGTC